MEAGGQSDGAWLVADIGGTRMRVALAGPERAPHALRELACADYAGPAEALAAYLAETGAHPQAACLAVAGPVGGDLFRFTNNAWSFSRQALRERLGLARLLLLNDFEALALALPWLRGDDVQRLGPAPAPQSARHAMAVLGPGTGLGVAALVPHGSHGWAVMPGEGGHAGFAPQDDLEREIERILRRRVRRVTNEHILSGPGLSALYQAIAEIEGWAAPDAPAPAEVSARALAGSDALAGRSVEVFCAVLGAVAGDVALITGARGGVFIGGGIAPRIAPVLARSRFRARFEDKGVQADYAGAIGTALIVAPVPALLGAAAALRAAPD